MSLVFPILSVAFMKTLKAIPILSGASGAEVAYRRFSGLRSRCTTPFSCRYCTEGKEQDADHKMNAVNEITRLCLVSLFHEVFLLAAVNEELFRCDTSVAG